MPSPISHIAAGYIVYRSLPAEAREKYSRKLFQLPLLVIFLFGISMLPDLDAVFGIIVGDLGSYHNQASHSLFTGFAAALVLAPILRWWLKGKYLYWFGLIFATYCVHLLLDMVTNGRGIMLFWPLSDERFLSPVLLFYGLRWSHGLWSITHLWTIISETGFWAIVFGLAHLYKKRYQNERT